MAYGKYLTWPAPAQIDLSRFSTQDAPPRRGIQERDGHQIISQVTVEEDGDDELMITEHPVQASAQITDHAFKRPSELRLRMGWSSAYLADNGSDTSQIYGDLLRLQAGRIPFVVYTGKRVYQNMLVAGLRTHTDEKMEFSFVADIHLKEIVLVNTSIVAGGMNYNGNALGKPDTNTTTSETGQKQTEPGSLSTSQINDMGGNDFGGSDNSTSVA